MKRSLKTSIFSLTFLLALLPLTAIGVSWVFKVQTIAKEAATAALNSRVDDVISHMDHELDLVSARILALGRDKDIVLGASNLLLRSQATTLLETFYRENPTIGKIGIVNGDNEFVVSEPKSLTFIRGSVLEQEIKNLASLLSSHQQLPFIVKAVELHGLSDKMNILELQPSQIDIGIMIAVPLMEDYISGKISGYLIGVVPISNLVTIARRNIDNLSEISLYTDSKGSNDLQIDNDVVRIRKAWSLPSKPSGLSSSLKVQIEEPYNRYGSILIKMLEESAYLFIAMMIAVALITYFYARTVTKPIELISKSVEAYAAGDYDHSTDNLVYRELNEIETTLAEMGGQIKARMNALEEKAKIESELQSAKNVAMLASQVAHDIRSPIAALKSILQSLSTLPPDKADVMERSVHRITQIANDLLEKRVQYTAGEILTSSKSNESEVLDLADIITSMITEKRYQLAQLPLIRLHMAKHTESPTLLAKVCHADFARVMSNIINNAIEAIDGNGQITVTLKDQDEHCVIQIEDTGTGIPDDVLAKIFDEGFTFGKANGSGLGLYHALHNIKAWGGSVIVSSKKGFGTLFSIYIPKHRSNLWFSEKLTVSTGTEIIIVDDDISIHDFWKTRFNDLLKHMQGVSVKHFSSPETVIAYMERRDKGPSTSHLICLVDFEFINSSINGVECIERMGNRTNSVLITGRSGERGLQDLCREKGIKLYAKSNLDKLGLRFTKELQQRVAILLDDEVWTRSTWTTMAREKDIPFFSFARSHDLLAVAQCFSPDSLFFIDSYLNEEKRGEEVAEELHNQGFKNIFMSTGLDHGQFAGKNWLKDVIGKEFPEEIISAAHLRTS